MLLVPLAGWAGPTHEVLASFDVPAQSPGYGALVAGPNGYYWGTTQGGGALGYGTVFKMKADGTELQTVLFFTGTTGTKKGRTPVAGLVSDGAGSFWGTTKDGGAGDFGTVFKVNASTGVLTTVVEFTNATAAVATNKGAYPYAGLVSDGAGFFWGSTEQGGLRPQQPDLSYAPGYGTIFKVSMSTGVLTTVREFTYDAASNRGAFPYATMVPDGAGSLWGTAYYGGLLGYGTIFKVNVSSGVLTTVVEFTDNGASKRGAYPWAALLNDGAGSFWGTTTEGGSLHGTLFKVNSTTGVLTTLVEFTNTGASNKGRLPTAALVNDGLGSYWGTTSAGATSGAGTLFKVNAVTGVLTTVLEFTNNGATNKGATCFAPLLNDGAGFWVGTTSSGGASGAGTVFKISITTAVPGVLTTLADFSASVLFGNGRNPFAGLVGDSAGQLWGANNTGGGASGAGTVFKLNPSTNALTSVVKFTGNVDPSKGASVYNALVNDGLGFFWGTSQGGGTTGNGTLFKINATTGAMTSVFGFAGSGTTNARGSAPSASLRSDGAGFLWGTTQAGGTGGGFGTIFKISPSTNALSVLVDFTSNGANNKGADPNGQLVSDGAGFLWGTTRAGGASLLGTIFKVNITSGVLTTVVEFTGNGASNRGSSPLAGLVSDGAGNLWGTTQNGGAGGLGTIFKVQITPGLLTTLVDFTGNGATNKGSKPNAALASDGAGNFWGTTSLGGATDNGTIFKVQQSSGILSTVFEFTGAGAQALTGSAASYGALFKHTDGNFYGTTIGGGPGGGTIYRVRIGAIPVTGTTGTVTATSAVLNGTINPNGFATTASFEYGTDAQLVGATVVSAGTTTAGTAPEAVTATLSGLSSGTTYYYRVRGLNAENPNPQTGIILSFTTAAGQPPVAGSTTVAIPASGTGTINLTTVASDPDNAPATLTFAILTTTGVTVTPVSGADFSYTANGTWTGSGNFTYRVTDPSGQSATGTITVVDQIAPTIPVLANLSVSATSGSGAVVTFTPTATDNVAVTSLTSAPASGSTFPNGTTTVTVTAQDRASNTATRTFTVTVNALPALSVWRQTYFGTTNNTGTAADSADPNGNGLANLIEYAFHLDPLAPATGTNAAPQVGKSAGNSLKLTFIRYLDRTDLTQSVAGADSPTGPWTDLATSVGGAPFAATAPGATAMESGSGATRTVTVTDSFVVTDPLHRRRYLRLNVTR